MSGSQQLQTLINVHFTCKGLSASIDQSRNKASANGGVQYGNKNEDGAFLNNAPAMLYFVFNERAVSVLVAHDPLKDEWVCQIPIFPPYQVIYILYYYIFACFVLYDICLFGSCF